MAAKKIVLAPSGFPWRPAVIGITVLMVGLVVGLLILGATALGGTFVVSAMIGAAAFAAALG